MEKWPILGQNHGPTPLEKSQFSDFFNILFLQPRKAFFRSRISCNTFSWHRLPKKTHGKMANFGPKPWTNPFGNNLNFPTFSTSCLYSLERRFFGLEYHITYFPGLDCLKRKDGKMANFRPKPWTNPFGKLSILQLFLLLVFIAYNGVFSL